MNVAALILAGGSGTRLWPLSRHLTPKQLIPLISNRSLLQATSLRIEEVIPPEDQWIITGNDHYFQVKGQLPKCNVLKEPVGRNTAPAVFWMANICREKYGDDSIMVVLPSDHLITMESEFKKVLRKGIEKAMEKCIVTFGITPYMPETGYGYIEAVEKYSGINENTYSVRAFVEKPDIEKAKTFIKSGKYLWNSGMFVFHTGTLLSEGERYCSDLYSGFSGRDLLDQDSINDIYGSIRSISIDYAVMEHTKKAYVIPADFGWSDLGSWKSLYNVSDKDEDENVVSGNCINIETSGSFIYGKEKVIATLGIKDTVIVDTDDALLVASMDKMHLMTETIKRLKEENNKILMEGRTVKRPWGSYTVIKESEGYKIKKITVLPGSKLSSQMHYHRSEHWIVVKGTARIVNGEEEIFLHENESTYIPKTTVHRLENPGLISLEIIEIQSGDYLEEDDIVRFDDVYGRAGDSSKEEGEAQGEAAAGKAD
jgi:mannose-1-phosphate guanylyltransferase/mannose-6-phosphate isomerase